MGSGERGAGILTAQLRSHALMQRHISTNLMKKQTHPNLRWTESTVSAHCHFWMNYSFNSFYLLNHVCCKVMHEKKQVLEALMVSFQKTDTFLPNF